MLWRSDIDGLAALNDGLAAVDAGESAAEAFIIAGGNGDVGDAEGVVWECSLMVRIESHLSVNRYRVDGVVGR